MRFVDTNVVVYAYSVEDPVKAGIAAEVLRDDDLALSVQVLQEFYAVSTSASRRAGISHSQALAVVETLRRFPVLPVDDQLVVAAAESSQRLQLSYWDAAILEAARALGCGTVLSEDLSATQDYDGIQVVNPFARDG